MKTHDLKTWPSYFEAVRRGEKTFEVRKNDRDFARGDELILSEWDPASLGCVGSFTGRELATIITYVLPGGQFGIEAGHCVIGFAKPELRKAQS